MTHDASTNGFFVLSERVPLFLQSNHVLSKLVDYVSLSYSVQKSRKLEISVLLSVTLHVQCLSCYFWHSLLKLWKIQQTAERQDNKNCGEWMVHSFQLWELFPMTHQDVGEINIHGHTISSRIPLRSFAHHVTYRTSSHLSLTGDMLWLLMVDQCWYFLIKYDNDCRLEGSDFFSCINWQ